MRSNYDTDVFDPIFKEIQSVTNAEPYGGLLATSAAEEEPFDILVSWNAYWRDAGQLLVRLLLPQSEKV